MKTVSSSYLCMVIGGIVNNEVKWRFAKLFGAKLRKKQIIQCLKREAPDSIPTRVIFSELQSLEWLGGTLVHQEEIPQDVALQCLGDDDAGVNNDHVVGVVDGQLLPHLPKGRRECGRLHLSLGKPWIMVSRSSCMTWSMRAAAFTFSRMGSSTLVSNLSITQRGDRRASWKGAPSPNSSSGLGESTGARLRASASLLVFPAIHLAEKEKRCILRRRRSNRGYPVCRGRTRWGWALADDGHEIERR